MTDDLPPRETWDVLERRVWTWILAPARQDVHDAMRALEERVETEERPTAAEVQDARQSLDRARGLVEEVYAELAEDTEPWGNGVSSTATHGVLAEQLEEYDYTVLRPSEEPTVGLAEQRGEACEEQL